MTSRHGTPGKGHEHRQPKPGGAARDPPVPTRLLFAVSVLITINCFIAWRPLNGAANMAFSLQLVNVICRCSLLLATPLASAYPILLPLTHEHPQPRRPRHRSTYKYSRPLGNDTQWTSSRGAYLGREQGNQNPTPGS